MLQQYFAAKAEHPGVLLAMRVGDFYEFYGEDAEIAAATLEITLTGREDGPGNRIAMAGVPFHSVEKYLARLLARGQRVALCDQLEDPKTAKGLVKRGVTRVLTPGTLVEDSMLDAGRNAFLAAICVQDGRTGLAVLDPSTGEFTITEVDGARASELILPELARLRPAELLVGPDAEAFGELGHGAFGSAVSNADAPSADRAARRLLEQLQASNLQGYGCEDKPAAVTAAAMILAYAERNHLALNHVDSLSTYSIEGFMRLDPNTRRSLELTQNLSDGGRRYTLVSVLDESVTPMGKRRLAMWVDQPLLDRAEIEARLSAVGRFINQPMSRGDAREILRRVSDLERLVARASTGHAGPRDLVALRHSLEALPALDEALIPVGLERIQELREMVQDHRDLARALALALVDDPPPTIREGGIIREGHDPELDKVRAISKDGKSYIASLERDERDRTGIGNLKVGYNAVFGYFLEVPKAQVAKVPDHYIRKQTTANAERYITADLKDQESIVLGAQDKANQLESHLFDHLRRRVAEHSRALLQTARAIAEIDALATLAEVAARRGYVRPEIVEEDVLEIDGGRHPVVEASSAGFVPNDTRIGEDRVLILTGPNMAGKSTYLRQNALIVLLAQIGSFVPARSAKIGICDRIFARIGAKDELALGQSTFMVEMVESANILNHASERSLVVLDEVGRGTSTYDGLAIAWAMIEHLAGIGAKTLFATHYHQLNALADQLPGVANYRVAVEEVGDDIVWTHRVLRGGTDRSYGIHVARMAGVPGAVLGRAAEILGELEQKTEAPRAIPTQTQRLQMTLFEIEEPEVVRELRGLDVNRLTPIEALAWLDRAKRHL